MNIRLGTEDDAAGIAAIYGPIVTLTPTSFEFEPPDESEMRRRIKSSQPHFAWLVCEHQSRIAGFAYAGPHRTRAAYQWSVDTSVYVHSDFHRSGIGTALYTSLFQILAAQGYVNAYAGITLPNPSSVGLHESLGFRPVGIYRNVGFKLGRWHDVGWWQRPLRQCDEAPHPCSNLNVLRDDPSWPGMLSAGLAKVRGYSESG